MTDPTPPRGVLHGAREYTADLLKHLVALMISFAIVFLAISGGALLSGSSDEIIGILRLIAAMAGATLLGHGLVTRLRGHVSLIASAFFTWISLVAIFTLQMLGADKESIVANFWFSLLVGLPIVALMTVLRAFVPVFQVRAAGHRVRPRMSSDA